MKTCSDQSPNVVALWRRRDQQMGSLVGAVVSHWSGLRHGGAVPRRADLDPQALASALPNSFLLEQPRPGVVRFRLAGQHLHHTMGMDVRGMPLRAFFEIADRNRLMDMVNRVFTDPATLDLELVSDAQGRATLEGRMCLMPLRGADDRVNRAIGVLATDGLIGLPPRRFRIRHSHLTAITPEDSPPEPGPRQTLPDDCARPKLRVLQGGKA